MFHELLTFHDSFEQFSDFNGVFRGILSKKMFLCTVKQCASRMQWIFISKLLRRNYCYQNNAQAECNGNLFPIC